MKTYTVFFINEFNEVDFSNETAGDENTAAQLALNEGFKVIDVTLFCLQLESHLIPKRLEQLSKQYKTKPQTIKFWK